MYTVLAVNPGHHGALAVVADGEVVLYVEEDRLSRYKYDGNPIRAIVEAVARYRIDEVVIGGTSSQLPVLPWTGEDPYSAVVRKYCGCANSSSLGDEHHLGHAAAAFYNSGFKTAAALVVDGAGSEHILSFGPDVPSIPGLETESIFLCAYPAQITAVYKSYGSDDRNLSVKAFATADGSMMGVIGSSMTIAKAYEAVSDYLGFGVIEAGKTMGLAPYGGPDENIPDLFINGRGNDDLLTTRFPTGDAINTERFPYLRNHEPSNVWHRDPSRINRAAKNLAWRVQEETQRLVADLIQLAVDRTGEKNIVIGGGYGLNCVANYSYLERFPDLNLYVDPISHDGGTAIGLALYRWHQHEQKFHPNRDWSGYTRKRIPHLYLGLDDPDRYKILESVEDFAISEASDALVADLLAQGQIVGFYHGRSEGGPRALGNRSLLFDPRVPDGKEIVNRVKRREWFRPFAGSVLHEYARDWFDMRTLDESPFMMYAVNALEDKKDAIPAITHVDGTCRIQTVKEEQNPRFHSLIRAFFEATGCPIVFNTSFNLAGEPLVETVWDALESMRKSDLAYLYLPEINKLLTKKT